MTLMRYRVSVLVLSMLSLHTVSARTPADTASTDDHALQAEVLLQSSQSWDGQPLPRYGDGTPEISILRVTIPPGEVVAWHKHPVINAGVLISGTLTVVSHDKQTLLLNTGDAIAELVDQWHYGINKGTEPAVILVFYAGEQGRPLSITLNP